MNLPCRNSRHGCTWGHVAGNNSIRSYSRSVTDGDASKNGNAAPDLQMQIRAEKGPAANMLWQLTRTNTVGR